MTLLQLIRQVLAELAFSEPAQVIGSTDPTVQTALAMIQRLGTDLTREDNWQRLVREHIITTRAEDVQLTATAGSRTVSLPTADLGAGWAISCEAFPRNTSIESISGPNSATVNLPATASGTFEATVSQVSYPLPTDWKCQVPQTEWEDERRWPMGGPLDAQQWAAFQRGIVHTAVRRFFRIMGNAFVLASPPPDGIMCSFEYVSRNWVIGADGVSKPAFTADTDTCVFDPSLMIVGTKVRFLQRAGLDATIETSEFQHIYQMVKGQDRSAPVLSIAPRRGRFLLSNRNIPDGDWRV